MTRYIIVSLCIALLWIVGYKSYTTSFTHDESYTYEHFVNNRYVDIVTYAYPHTNNHIVNTLMMKVSEKIFGSSELALRLHSLLSLAVYLLICMLLIKEFPLSIRLGCFVLLIVNPYLIDFFGLARGYAVAISCMMVAIYFISMWLKTNKLMHLAAFNVFAMLAAYSHFILIDFYVSAVFAVNIIAFCKTPVRLACLAKINAINILFMVITILVLWVPIKKITRLHMFEYGGRNNVVADTIYSVICASLYHITVPHMMGMILSWIITLIITIILLKWVRGITTGNHPFSTNFYMLVFANCTLVAILLCSIAQHYILKNDYFIGRFALFLYPLFILNIVFSLKLLYEKYKLSSLLVLFPNVFVVLFVSNFLYNINTTSYLDWEYDSDTKQVMNILERHHSTYEQDKNVKLGLTWYFEPTINFYRITKKLDWLEPADREGLLKSDNYIYAKKNEVANFKTMRQQVLFSSESGTTLLYIK